MARLRSLKVDNNDWSKLRHGRDQHVGTSIAMEYFQHCPFFFTREGAGIDLMGQARGASGYLIASGPSFNKINKELLRTPGVWTMTLNNAVASWRGNAACVVDDPCRFTMSLWLDPSITKFVPMSAFEKPLWDNRLITLPDGRTEQQWTPANLKVGDCPNIIGYRRNEKFVAGRYLYEDTINWGCHKDFGGGRSVMLAALRIMFLLGFRQVYLLGVDFEMTAEKRYHFEEDRTNSAVNGNMSTYEKMKSWFTELQPHFLKEGFIVKNCNPESKLTAFPFISFEDSIRESTAHIGDAIHERTKGMYAKFEEKMALLQKPSVQALQYAPPAAVVPMAPPQQPPRPNIIVNPVVYPTNPMPPQQGIIDVTPRNYQDPPVTPMSRPPSPDNPPPSEGAED